MKPVFISGIKPSGQLHIGNYLGALRNFVDLQNSEKYECYCFIADLHAITEPQEPKELHAAILDVAASYLAAGIDPKKVIFFLQSQIPAHSELAWVLNTITPMGELERMTQFKDKSQIKEVKEMLDESMSDARAKKILQEAHELRMKFINVGLFDYPVLMSADVLLYDASVVPVGDDQLQHLELTRTLARKFNKRFGKTFIEPKDMLTKTPRVMSLKDPAKKMSKSQPEGCLFLDDSPGEIKAKIARAVTDSGSEIEYDPRKKPGLSNLLEIYGALTDIEPSVIAKKLSGKQYSVLKKQLADIAIHYFADFREQKKILLAKPASLTKILDDGSEKAAKVANAKMAEVKKRIGLIL